MNPGGIIGLVLGVALVTFAVVLMVRPPDVDFFREDDSIRYLLAACAAMLGTFRIYRGVRILRGRE